MSTRAWGRALAARGRWAELQGVHALAAPRFVLRAYLQERAADGAPAHRVMAQAHWKTVRVVKVYTQAKEARQGGEVAGVGTFSHYADALSGAIVLVWLAVLWAAVACNNVAINSAEDMSGGVMRMR